MRRYLALGFLLISSGAFAQAERPREGCSVLIGRNWIPMSATTVNDCFKFAEAAASPGERQLAAFNSNSLAYQDGRYFLSRDGGETWRNVNPRKADTTLSSLNKLSSPDEVAAAVKATTQVDDSKKNKAQVVPTLIVSVPTPVLAPAPVTEAPTPIPALVPVAVPAQAEAAISASAVIVAEPTPAPAARAAGVVAANPTTFHACQIKNSDDWQSHPTATVAECGARLSAATVKSGAKSGQAYWGGIYLFYTAKTIYQSPDGEQWKALE